jgi:uncharacterized membrane protein YjjP (DUF1212 family)
VTDSRPNALDAKFVDETAHLALHVGRLLLQNGTDTAQVQASVARFAGGFGCQANLLVNYEALLVTAVIGESFRTKVGHQIRAMNVNMAAVSAVNQIVDEAAEGRLEMVSARARLEVVEHARAIWNRWLVVVAMGLCAASLSVLFLGDWPTFWIVWVAGSVGMWLRQELSRRGMNLFFIAFAGALVSGIVGGIGVHLGWSGTPALCLVAPGMIIVPGVPLVNGVQDMFKNHMTLGLSRLGLGILITLAIALGLFVATLATGAAIPVEAPFHVLSVPMDALFSALAALGYLFLFNVPGRIAWACVVCGVVSHTGRTLCLHLGMDILGATLLGALAVGFLAQGFARHFRVPAAAFAFPGVVAMIPGAFAFRAFIGSLEIAHAGANAAPALIAETFALTVTCVLMVAAIAIGVAGPVILMKERILK